MRFSSLIGARGFDACATIPEIIPRRDPGDSHWIARECRISERALARLEVPMADVPTIIWAGKSGVQYTYWIHPIGTTFKAEAGNYIFARNSPQGWYAIYIGETGDLSTRFPNHHQADCITRNGATHIHAHTAPGGDQVRRDEETDLRGRWNAPCNMQ